MDRHELPSKGESELGSYKVPERFEGELSIEQGQTKAEDRSLEEGVRKEEEVRISEIRADLGLRPISLEGFENGLQAFSEHIHSLLEKMDRLLVSVAGKTGSGKTAFADQLKERLSAKGISAEVVNTDDFYKKEGGELDLNRLHEVLRHLEAGHHVGHLKPAKVVIVEGLQTIDDSVLGQRADSRAYIEVPFAERIARRLLRDQKSGFRSIKDALKTIAQLSDKDLARLKSFEADPNLENVRYRIKNDYRTPGDPHLYVDRNSNQLVFAFGSEIQESVFINPVLIPVLSKEVGVEVR